MNTSRATMAENRSGLGLNISYIAAWLAPPPIQVPATVLNPLQTSSAPSPPTISGANNEIKKTAAGPPSIILIEAVINIKPAFFLNFHISLKSRLKVNNTRLAGKRYLDAMV